MTQKEYLDRELKAYWSKMTEIETAPLAERKENRNLFAKALHEYPNVIVDRIGWLLGGSYGYGFGWNAYRVKMNGRMNRNAYMLRTIAAVEWGCTPADATKEWKQLSPEAKQYLDTAITAEIEQNEVEY